MPRVEVTVTVDVPVLEDTSPVEYAAAQACYGFTQGEVPVLALSARIVEES